MTVHVPKSLVTHLGVTDAARNLPVRVQNIIRAQEERSEKLIGWVQLALISTFGLLYLLSPKPADTILASFQPVPFALALYFLFTITRIWLSYRLYMPGWLLVLSMIVDMAMLFGLIWSFHVQYEQPPAFYLKIPTFLYVFLFIALRALRFDHRFVLSAGLFAATGWLLMLGYALNEAGMKGVTRNFVEYLTGNYILIGAEFDKIFAILATTTILTYAAWRARVVLIASVREEAAHHEIKRFLSEGVDEAITGSEAIVEAGQGVERDAAILMVDIRGFTQFSSRVSPREVVTLLTSFHGKIIPLIRENNGVVDKFLGDGVMATFGAVKPSETAAADALRALGAIMDAADEWRAELERDDLPSTFEVNGAVASGPIIFAALGAATRMEFTVIGEAANMAAKLEKHNKAEGVKALTDNATYSAAVGQGFTAVHPVEERRKRMVAGAPEPIDLVVLRQANVA
ncbi:MAG: adenylate/guanylate cyclase domain-containing protein [Pseudomonadota bacterium]